MRRTPFRHRPLGYYEAWRHPLVCNGAGLSSKASCCPTNNQKPKDVEFTNSKRQETLTAKRLPMNVGSFAWWIICCRFIFVASLIDFSISEHVCICGSLCIYVRHSLVAPEGDLLSQFVLVFHIETTKICSTQYLVTNTHTHIHAADIPTHTCIHVNARSHRCVNSVKKAVCV